MVSSVREKYPNVTEKEILKGLNENYDSSFFRNYGIDLEDTFVITRLQEVQRQFQLYMIVLSFFFLGLIVWCYVYFEKKNRNEVLKVCQLIDDINHKIYTIALEEEVDDVYGVLRSELYKTAIMLKEQAERADLEKEVLKTALSDISHQIKTPLTSILIMLDTFSDYPAMEVEKRNEFLEDIRMQIQRIHVLTMTLLKLARLDAEVVQFKNVEIDGKKFIESVINHLEVLVLAKNIHIEIQGNTVFFGDFLFLEEAFINILKNCIEASYDDGYIWIRMEDNPFYSKFVIQDEGIGISKVELAHIFERFYKSSNSSVTSIGIGLSLSKKIIEAHHGHITCNSVLGKGTTFEIKFMHNW